VLLGRVPDSDSFTGAGGTEAVAIGGTGSIAEGESAVYSGGVPSPRAQVLITVPVMALLGVTEEPAMLDGCGPIPPSMAWRLIADGAGSFHRVLIDPRDGAPLEIGVTSYPVTNAQRQWLRLRGWAVPVPRLQQPVPGQRSRPYPRLGQRRDHRDLESRPAVPPPPQAPSHHRLDAHRRHQERTTGLDFTRRTAVPKRTPRLEPPTLPDWQLTWNAAAPDESDVPEEFDH
jgi:hypothetical protein